ncbi:MAG: glutathione S-transferase family protein [Pseudomonadota bacterium]
MSEAANVDKSAQPVLRIFTYLPNPRLWKAQITARIAGVDIDVRGAKPPELANWLWDFDARPLDEAGKAEHAASARQSHTGFKTTLYKTDAFLATQPFGTVPAAFSPDGATGVFESNSIMRAVARAAPDVGLYGADPYSASRIDGFLDASLAFARDSQHYLLALGGGSVSRELHERMRDSYAVYMGGMERALAQGEGYLCGAALTLADICFACELALFSREPKMAARATFGGEGDGAMVPRIAAELRADAQSAFPQAIAHALKLAAHPAFAADMQPYLAK